MGALKLAEQQLVKVEETAPKLSVVQPDLTAQEESFATLIANIIVDFTLKQFYEERNTLSAI